MENSIKSSTINYGLYLGGTLTLFTVLVYAIDLELMTNTWYALFVMLVIVAFGVVSVAKAKGILEGYISFKQSFKSYFITILIGLVIAVLVSYILFNFIDPEAANVIKEKTIEASISMMEGFGADPDIIAETVDAMEEENQFSIGNIVKSLGFQLILYSVIGLIVAAIMKKNPEND